jgi:hypothetical protein
VVDEHAARLVTDRKLLTEVVAADYHQNVGTFTGKRDASESLGQQHHALTEYEIFLHLVLARGGQKISVAETRL